jgi:hypothetical protein
VRPRRHRRGRRRLGIALLMLAVLVVGAAAGWLLFPQRDLDGPPPAAERGEPEPRRSPAVERSDAERREAGERTEVADGAAGEEAAGPLEKLEALVTPEPESSAPPPRDASPVRAADLERGDGFDAGLADGVAVHFGSRRIPYEVFGVYVTPGETVPIRLEAEAPRDGGMLWADAGVAEQTGPGAWRWQAPGEPGVHRIDIALDRVAPPIRLNVFVLIPRDDIGPDGQLAGYRIGDYPAEPLRGLAQYLPPQGFIEVTPERRDLLVSPHFTLGQFLCKQVDGWPKFVTLREPLLGKLEVLLAHLNRQGVRADTLFVMSGFRTPFYNHAIGNVRYSRHQWGDAGDVFVDESPRDGVMDDIDGDGRVTVADAHHLAGMVENLARTDVWEPYVGGLGIYGTTSTHGPFIHVDTRGFRARWTG